ncbi:rhomboid family intramembrane serine protease [Halocatena pleomorpha]|uniref:Rhomboid family intramembrane serine protease n=1 Tax=Halocatena pleomorpha TaxID=1785090 RepID=A0A3P3R334_9EURY|nr:rhomboid family intramembrane serine protease [Halocatena pleomorpha]RRJ27887.1 rhomboid family intramembrane serine protease [Halocatena pleomorpha]
MQPLPGPALLLGSLGPVPVLFLVSAIVFSCGVAWQLGGRERYRTVRTRLLFGVPWGSLSVAAGLLGVYWFVQGGWSEPHAPLVIPFRSWSYFAPTGIVLSSFTHSSYSHLLGNLIGTLTVGVLAEYAWSHYPRGRGVGVFSSSIWTNPYARTLAFVSGSVVVGLVSGVFSLGPTIGFSGVVFAYVGLALMRYPWGTLLALLWSRVLFLVYRSLTNPTIIQGGGTQFNTPWWAGISLQGHAFGLLIGIVLGVVLVERRSVGVDRLRLWTAVILFAVLEGVWAVYLPVSGGRFMLFRAIGVGLVFLFAAVFMNIPRRDTSRLVGGIDVRYGTLARRITVAFVLVLAIVSVPYNVYTVSESTAGITAENSIEVGEYIVAYAEEIPHQYISAVQIDAFGEPTNVTTSGVIVINDRREIWWPEISKRRLTFVEEAGVRVGGIGVRETVRARRLAWNPAGNHSVYTVQLVHDDDRSTVYTSQPSQAKPVIDGRRITIVPGEQFRVRVTHNGSVLGDTPMPARNETDSIGGLTLNRTERKLYAERNNTRVQVAKYDPP